ncbi:MAG: hypothetical protein UX09_C0058G0002 [Candidatus Uhrbacteria bacterium GW2011_GWE2_45_35]|uniref:NYN domain-containing protein n=2 Tax=Candidatus Uhriibacteriota TaxID=1752732 RepID=A0A0G1JE95_9BACT|nr:MAG: hypothetical protein UW63_C0049G0007 [Candidatus Uhrbacteria bacterium GW2011_GWF2_44_350]KKU06148.1 MAG: hypothetical protein UX09_C0058G0002 [Candidatus Uhrbacteria bacterium GW2011_GWE2_45_35]
MISHPDQRVGIFIDTQNMYYSARNVFGRKVNFGNILKEAVGTRKLIRAVAYVVRTKSDEERPFFDALKNLGIETREKELVQYESGQKKADWDVGLTVDVIRMLDMLDVVVLVSGDGDFAPLVEYVKNRGRIVEVMSFRETTAGKITEVADLYINLSENDKKFLIGPIRRGPMNPPKGGEVLVEKKDEEIGVVDDEFWKW